MQHVNLENDPQQAQYVHGSSWKSPESAKNGAPHMFSMAILESMTTQHCSVISFTTFSILNLILLPSFVFLSGLFLNVFMSHKLQVRTTPTNY